MLEHPHNRRRQDSPLISLELPHEVRYWTEALQVDFHELKRVVEKVGYATEAVKRELAK